MAFLRATVFLAPALVAFAAGCMVFLLAVGAFTSRAEEEYWSRFWRETPVTETGRREDASAAPERDRTPDVMLRKAA